MLCTKGSSFSRNSWSSFLGDGFKRASTATVATTKVGTYNCVERFRIMAFAQLTYRHSLREVEARLRVVKSRLYHMGIQSLISHSNLTHANHQRDWRIYADFAQILIQRAKQLYWGDDRGLDLCLSLFPWAKFRRAKGAVKLHTLLNLQGDFPNSS